MRMKNSPPSGSVECWSELMMFAPEAARKPATAATMPWRSWQVISRRPFTQLGGYFARARRTRRRRAGGARRAGAARRDRAAAPSPSSGRSATPLNSRASSRGMIVTARPCATSARLASGSREIITSRGVKPAAWHARAIRLSPLGATQGSSASAASGTASCSASGCPGGSATRNGSRSEVAPLDAVVLAPGLRRVLEADGEVQLAAPDALGELGRRALLERAPAPSRARRPAAPARRARSGTRRSAAGPARVELPQLAFGEREAAPRSRRRARAGLARAA